MPDGKIIATETLSFAWVSVQVVTMWDIPHVWDLGVATEVSCLLVVAADIFFSSLGVVLKGTEVDFGGVVVGVGNGNPRT